MHHFFQKKNELKFSVELGTLIHVLQEERDMSVLYLSALGPETKSFLLSKYLETDEAINAISEWPTNMDFTDQRLEFSSTYRLRDHLSRHRQLLSKTNYDVNDELDFYTNIIDVVIVWLYKSITQGKFAQVWKTLVAYLKLISGKQVVGIERALGTLFYVQGGFPSQQDFEQYNTRINRFKAFYKTAELYSPRVDRLYTSGVEGVGTNITGIINNFRHEIQFHGSGTDTYHPDIRKAQFWFDNMTLYLETILVIQKDLGLEIIESLDEVIAESVRNLTISAVALVAVLIMCPLVIFASENLTSNIQKYALALTTKTKELGKEKSKVDAILYQMVPKSFVKNLNNKETIEAEFFQCVTVLFCDIYDFDGLTAKCTPNDILEFLNEFAVACDELITSYDVFKIEIIRHGFMIASGQLTFLYSLCSSMHITNCHNVFLINNQCFL